MSADRQGIADTLAFQDTALASLYEVAFADSLMFHEATDTTRKQRPISDALSFGDQFESLIWFDLRDRFSLADGFIVQGLSASFSDHLSWTEVTRPRVDVASVSEVLATTDAFESNSQAPQVQDSLVLSDAWSLGEQSLSVVDGLTTSAPTVDFAGISNMPAAGGLLDAIAAAAGGLVDAFTINGSAGLVLSDRLNLADGPSASNLLSTATPVESHDSLSIADEFDATFGVPTVDQISLSDHFAAAHIGEYGVVDALFADRLPCVLVCRRRY